MTTFRILLVSLFFAGNLLAGDPASKPLKVVFWNVEWFPGGHPEATEAEAQAQTALVQPILAGLKPDVVGLEEVRDWSAAALAVEKTAGTKVQVCSDFVGEDGAKTTQQVVVASHLPAIGGWWEQWKAGEKITPKRGFSFAAFQPTPGNVVLVYCVHLKSNRGNLKENIAMREESASQLLSHIAAMEKAYGGLGKVSVIVGGDFNTTQDDAKFNQETTLTSLEKAGLVSCWKNRPLSERVTIPSSPSKNPKLPPFPDACFDYVFVKGAKIASAAVDIPTNNPSDHRPVVVEVELPSPGN